MDHNQEDGDNDALVQTGVVVNEWIRDSISVTSSKRKRAKSIDAGSFKSLSSVDFSDVSQNSLVNQVHEHLSVMEEKLSVCMNQQGLFRDTANQLVEEVRDSILVLNQTQAQQQLAVNEQKNQMGELIEQTKKLIIQCSESSRDLKTQQSVFSQQFVQMKQWQSEVEKELQNGLIDRHNLMSHAQSKQTENQIIKEELQAMKTQNRNRVAHPLVHGESRTVLGGDSNALGGSSNGVPIDLPLNVPKKAYNFDNQTTTTNQSHAPTRDQTNQSFVHGESKNVFGGDSNCFGGSSGSVPNDVPQSVPQKACPFNGSFTSSSQSHAPTQDRTNNENHENNVSNMKEHLNHSNNVMGMNPVPGPMQWLLPNGMIDSCPGFTPNTFQNWLREVKLWKAAQVGANPTQLISKIVTVLPLNIRMEVLAYLESTESNSESRSVDTVIQMLNTRYGKTDSERAWSWLSSFTEFKRESAENFKDFWTRFTRCTTRLNAHGMNLSESIIFHRAIQALRLPEGQLPILLATLETFPNPTSVTSLRELSIKMYETHKSKIDPSEVFTTGNTENGEEHSESEEESTVQLTNEEGKVFLMKVKKAVKSRNKPGQAESSKRGSVTNFQGVPNGIQKPRVCIRCGDPSHFVRDCPHPYRAVLDPRFATTFVKKNPAVTHLANDTSEVGESKTEETEQPVEPEKVNENSVTPEEQRAEDELYKLWGDFYQSQHACSTNMISVECNYHAKSGPNMTGQQLTDDSPLILLDSGASRSVCGISWLKWWYKGEMFDLKKSTRSFRFGAGPLIQSSGTIVIMVHVNPKCTNSSKPLILPICVDVVESNVPMLVSYESLKKMKGSLNFLTACLTILSGITIQLSATPSGHLMIQGSKAVQKLTPEMTKNHESIFTMEIRLPVSSLTFEELKRIHLQLGHCSENTLLSVIKAAQLHGEKSLIEKLYADCKCQVAVQRITPPNVACWLAKYNGEIVAIDIIFPFKDCCEEKLHKQFPALFMIDSLSRFINCSMLIGRTAEHVGSVFVNDWVRTIGKPRRIITDAGGPSLTGNFWRELSHVYGWQMIQAPQFTPQQNGLAERAVRSFKIAVKNIFAATKDACPCQEILTQAVIAKNHVPHTTTGLPPALAMTGRCDILAGFSHTAFNHDPEIADSVMKANNGMRTIMNARNAIIFADAKNAVRTMISRKAPDRFWVIFCGCFSTNCSR